MPNVLDPHGVNKPSKPKVKLSPSMEKIAAQKLYETARTDKGQVGKNARREIMKARGLSSGRSEYRPGFYKDTPKASPSPPKPKVSKSDFHTQVMKENKAINKKRYEEKAKKNRW